MGRSLRPGDRGTHGLRGGPTQKGPPTAEADAARDIRSPGAGRETRDPPRALGPCRKTEGPAPEPWGWKGDEGPSPSPGAMKRGRKNPFWSPGSWKKQEGPSVELWKQKPQEGPSRRLRSLKRQEGPPLEPWGHAEAGPTLPIASGGRGALPVSPCQTSALQTEKQ